MNVYVTFMVSASDPITAEVSHNDIATIQLGDLGHNVIQMHTANSTPAEQVAWWRKLSIAAEEIAEQVELVPFKGTAS